MLTALGCPNKTSEATSNEEKLIVEGVKHQKGKPELACNRIFS
jgi:hypothetical protein